jgi:hypothetical protein
VCVESPNYFVYLANEERHSNQTLQLADDIIPSLKMAL